LQPLETADQPNAAISVTGMMGKLQLDPKLTKVTQHGPSADVLEDFILDSLTYKSMRDREEEVAEAHGKTFEWIFEPRTDRSFNHQFTTWLTTDELGPIYWVSGKPGSGKSTLMRFLFGHSSTMTCLESWAGNLPFSKAGFFFWTSGSEEQRSQTGLLKYLLHQLLSENRTMMPNTFPDLWQRLQTMTTKERIKLSQALEWETTELMSAFRSFVSAAVEYSKICLFVDGLDEFDGDHHEMIRFFKSMGDGVHGDRVKMCLSSRPWAVFERSFQSSVPNLKLQELTYQDMYYYVADRLSGDLQIGTLLIDHATFKQAFFDKLVRRTDGVFLWAKLAVSKILKDFQPSHDIGHLQAILQSLPTELEDFFEKFLFSEQDAVELSEMANIFQLITAREIAASFVNDETANSLNIWEIALALDPEDDALALSDGGVRQASDEEVQSRCENTRVRIDQRFIGLLEAFPKPQRGNSRFTETDDEEDPSSSCRRVAEYKVTYVHRTIRDWLMEGDGVRERLISKSPETFDPHLRLLRSGILSLKVSIKRPRRGRWLNDWWPHITMCMTHARSIQRDQDDLQRSLLNELDRTIGWYWVPRPGDPSDHWAKHMFGSYEIRMKAPPIRKPYLCLVAKFGVADYVRSELQNRALEDKVSQASLEPATPDDEAPGEECNEEETVKERRDAGGKRDVARDKDDEEEVGKEVEEEEEEEEEEDRREGTPLLSYATEFLCSRKKTIYPLSSPSFVHSLLETPSRHNPGPNHAYIDFLTKTTTSPWLALLRHLRLAHRRGWITHLDIEPQGTPRWAEIVRLFLEADADVDAIVAADKWGPEISALGVLEMLESEYCAVEVRELKKLVATLRDHGEASLDS
jgi:hypothetical protein